MNFNFANEAGLSHATMWDGLSRFCAAYSLTITDVSNYRENGPIRARLENGATLWCQAAAVNELMVYLHTGGQEQLFQMLFCARQWQIKNF